MIFLEFIGFVFHLRPFESQHFTFQKLDGNHTWIKTTIEICIIMHLVKVWKEGFPIGLIIIPLAQHRYAIIYTQTHSKEVIYYCQYQS